MNETQFNRNLSEFSGRASLPCVVTFVYGIFQCFNSVSRLQGLIMIVGSIVTILGIFGFMIAGTAAGCPKKSWGLSLLSLSGLFPYLFGCYVTLYKGVWSLFVSFFGSFSLKGILLSIIWTILGYRLVSQFYLLTELVTAIDDGRIKIEKES